MSSFVGTSGGGASVASGVGGGASVASGVGGEQVWLMELVVANARI